MFQRKDGLYQEKIYMPSGKPKYFYGKTERIVLQKLADWKGEQEVRKNISFETAADEWDNIHTEEIAYNTAQSYIAPLKDAKEYFKNKPVKDITEDDIKAFLRKLAANKLAKQTVKLRLIVVKQVLDYCKPKYISLNPALGVKLPPKLKVTKRVPPPKKALEAVKLHYDRMFGLFAFTLLYTGLRRGEALALRWKDIDFENKQVIIEKQVIFKGTKSIISDILKSEASYRTLFLPKYLIDVLLKYKGKDNNYIFNIDGKVLNASNLRTLWENYKKLIGFEITAHQLRHAYATMLYLAGVGIKEAQRLLGHATVKMTMDIYTEIEEELKEYSLDKLDVFLLKSTTPITTPEEQIFFDIN